MTRRLNWVLAAFLLLLGPLYYWLLVDNRPGTAAAKPVTIAQLRHLAAAIPGARAERVEMELVGWRTVPGTLFAAGTGLRQQMIGVMAYRLPVAGGRPVLIDTGLSQEPADAMGLSAFQTGDQGRVDRALAEAGMVLVTHEHPDHLRGLANAGPGPQAVAVLNAPLRRALADLSKGAVLAGPSRDDPSPFAVAPGIVAIPAPSHTPGSQMFFVLLAGGREFLFTGDIATLDASWQDVRARSRLVGDHLAPEDRAEVFAWLRTIRALKQEAPGLVVIPGHDTHTLLVFSVLKTVHKGFSVRPAPQ